MAEDKVKPAVFTEFVAEQVAKDKTAVVQGKDPWGPETKVPGFTTLTLGMAEAYEITWEMLAALLDAKNKYFEATLVPTTVGLHVVRGFPRREWATLQKEIIVEAEARVKEHMDIKSNQEWIKKDIDLHSEEKIALIGTVFPEYDKLSIRSIPAGVVEVLAKSCIWATGFETKNQLPPMKL